MKIQYKITLHTYWHCGSGLAAGAQADSLVVKDNKGMPYIPGKTIKGLLRDAVDEILSFKGITGASEDYLKAFGYFDDKATEAHKSESFFTNACLIEQEYKEITAHNLQQFLYKMVASTAINGETGTAREHSLRTMEVVVPCTLEGSIIDLPEGMGELMGQGMRYVKQLGSGRTRGLGRCTIEITKEEEEERSNA